MQRKRPHAERKGLRPPIAAALARAAEAIPSPSALPGGTTYEPKFDGFRVLIFRSDDDEVSLWSRQGKDLTRHFPDLAAAAVEQLPPGVVVDGEAVVWSNDRLDFNALQQRLTTSTAGLRGLAAEHPASYVAFDVLEVGGQDARAAPFSARRDLLQTLAAHWRPPLHISPSTDDPAEAQAWVTQMAAAGVEGVVAKGRQQPYLGGQRQWIKVKHRETLEIVCGAVLGSIQSPAVVIAGLPLNGRLRIVGRTGPLARSSARSLSELLAPAGAGHPWPPVVSPGVLDRFSRDREPVRLVRVEPVVVEVAADVAWSGRSFRHVLRFVRPRPELSWEDVGVPEWLG